MCQFSPHASRPTLKDFITVPGVYPAGRLDWDSEGLVVLTDEGRMQHRISDPRQKLEKAYWVQVEGEPTDVSLQRLRGGLDLGDFVTRPARAARIAEPADLWPRQPPIRYRRAIPTSWLEIALTEGKTHEVRRMTAAIGFPTLRLVRVRIGQWTVTGLEPGQHRSVMAADAFK